jgi:dimethylargininase
MSSLNKQAIVRAPGKSYINCVSTHPLKETIDVEKAKSQHESFCRILKRIGLKVKELEPDEKYPDGCFVEDCAIIHKDIAVICNLKPLSRKGEEVDVEAFLGSHKKTKKILPPAVLEGGNVLQTDKEIFVGISERTNTEAIDQLRKILPMKITRIDLEKVIHLKEICTYLGQNVMLVSKDYLKHLPLADYEIIEVSPEEAYAANCFCYNKVVVAPKGYDRTIKEIKKRDFEVIELETSEFEKGDGSITCLSIVF